MAWDIDLVLDFQSLYLCTWEVKREPLFWYLSLFIPQSTQKTGCSNTLLVSFIHYRPFANCFIISRLGQTNIWHKLVPFIVSRQCICSNIMFGVFFPPCNSLYSVQADQYSAAVICRCSAIFHPLLRNLIMHCPTQIGPEYWWARRSFITQNISVRVWRFSQRWRPGIVLTSSFCSLTESLVV